MKEGWEIKNLGEVCLFCSGYTPKGCELSNEGSIPYFKVSDMNHSENIKYLTHTSLFLKKGCKVYPKHTIVFPKNGAAIATNKKRILQQDSVVDLNTAGVIANKSIVNHEYLYLYLLGLDFRQYTRGGAVPTLDIAELKNKQIPVPSLSEQEKIVAELDCLSGIIEKKKQQLKEYDALAQSIFYEMFGDPVENEKGWEIKKLEIMCRIINGFAFPSTDFSESNPIKAIKITNVGVNEFISDDSSLPNLYDHKIDYKVHTGDIVIALTRTVISSGLKRAIIPEEYDNALVNQRVAAIITDNKVADKSYIYSYLGTSFVQDYVLAHATALMQPNLSIKDLRELPVIYPPLALQQEFAS